MVEDDFIGAEDDEIEETFAERLIGLTEMLPGSVRNAASNVVNAGAYVAKNSFRFLRQAVWIGCSTALIGIVPYLIEKERFDFEEKMREDERNSLRKEVLGLYKQIFKAAAQWEAATKSDEQTKIEKEYIRREARSLFRLNKSLAVEEEIRKKLREGEARLAIGCHYRNPYPRPVYAPPQTMAGIDERKKKIYKEKLRRDGKPIYIDSIRDE